MTRHCVGGGGEESRGSANCERREREYNVPLRVGLLFVILATSAIGVYLPILTTRFTSITTDSILFAMLKQFGTGVILSTAFVHARLPTTLFNSKANLRQVVYTCVFDVR
jgi:zinc transporter 1/2/3